jgi:Xaa-Pro dipeptidase
MPYAAITCDRDANGAPVGRSNPCAIEPPEISVRGYDAPHPQRIASMNSRAPDAVQEIDDLFAAHVAALRHRYEQAMERCGLDAVIVSSGPLEYRFLDDQTHPYVANPHFLQWAPLGEHPGSAVIVQPGRQPILVVLRGEDYWNLPPALPGAAVADAFDVRVIGSAAEFAAQLPSGLRHMALLGPHEQWQGALPEAARNPATLLDILHYHRAWKSPWEIACIRQAAALAAPGHRAAEQAFRAGGNEYDILMAFLRASGQLEPELPYGAIVALNEHGATLHYQHRERRECKPRDLHSLLIDVGCMYHGYACDITRSYAFRDDEFAAMIAALDAVQRDLCATVRADVPFPDLHRQAHRAIAGLLHEWQLVRASPEAILDAGITLVFFPHGLGHLLGVQVHDLGGQLADDTGGTLPAPPDYPRLRLTRTLDVGQVVTIEPGIYFIDSLLEGLRDNPLANRVNWEKIGHLKKYGGIRIEDDVLVTTGASENLTRPLLGQ